jgi:hypothetical protein
VIKLTATLLKFGQQGEKTGWTYIEIPEDVAQKIKPGNKKEFKVRGKLDQLKLQRVSLLPMGGGKFIMAVNASMRKQLGKSKGAMVKLELEEDKTEFVFNKDFMICLQDDPQAMEYFQRLPGSHQRYFSKWIDSAKTDPTKIKRITMAVDALSKKWNYGQMIRAASGKII